MQTESRTFLRDLPHGPHQFSDSPTCHCISGLGFTKESYSQCKPHTTTVAKVKTITDYRENHPMIKAASAVQKQHCTIEETVDWRNYWKVPGPSYMVPPDMSSMNHISLVTLYTLSHSHCKESLQNQRAGSSRDSRAEKLLESSRTLIRGTSRHVQTELHMFLKPLTCQPSPTHSLSVLPAMPSMALASW